MPVPRAVIWLTSPFKDWIGQRTLNVSWEGDLTVRSLWQRLAAEHPKLRANLPAGEHLEEEPMSQLAAVIVDGDILGLDALIRDGARVDILTPLSGGRGRAVHCSQ